MFAGRRCRGAADRARPVAGGGETRSPAASQRQTSARPQQPRARPEPVGARPLRPDAEDPRRPELLSHQQAAQTGLQVSPSEILQGGGVQTTLSLGISQQTRSGLRGQSALTLQCFGWFPWFVWFINKSIYQSKNWVL